MREKAERQLRAAEQWEKGSQGERATAEALAALSSESWTTFHDLSWPGRPRANIDHVVIGPGGVFMIDSKNWSGRIEVRQEMLLQDGRRREPPVTAAAEAALALSPVVAAVTGQTVVPVLCFVSTERVVGWARDVMVCSTANVAPMLASRPVVLTLGQVREASLALDASLRGAGPAPGPVATHAVTPSPSRPASPARARPARPAPRPTAPSARSSASTRSRRRSRGTSPAHAVVGLALVAVLLVPSWRQSTTALISGFIVSTATEGRTPPTADVEADRTPVQEKRQQRRERRQQRGASSRASVSR